MARSLWFSINLQRSTTRSSKKLSSNPMLSFPLFSKKSIRNLTFWNPNNTMSVIFLCVRIFYSIFFCLNSRLKIWSNKSRKEWMRIDRLRRRKLWLFLSNISKSSSLWGKRSTLSRISLIDWRSATVTFFVLPFWNSKPWSQSSRMNLRYCKTLTRVTSPPKLIKWSSMEKTTGPKKYWTENHQLFSFWQSTSWNCSC